MKKIYSAPQMEVVKLMAESNLMLNITSSQVDGPNALAPEMPEMPAIPGVPGVPGFETFE